MVHALVTTFDDPAVPLMAAEAGPAPLGSGVTPSGLPYPTSTDYVAQTARYVRDLSDAAGRLIANPGIVLSSGAVGTDAQSRSWLTFTSLVSLAGLVVAPYRSATDRWCWIHVIETIVGNTAAVRWAYWDDGPYDHATHDFPNNQITVSVYAWGSI